MLYGALVQTSQRSSEGFDRLSPNGNLLARWLQSPFGLSLSKALRGISRP
jgi:hypothetical protein